MSEVIAKARMIIGRFESYSWPWHSEVSASPDDGEVYICVANPDIEGDQTELFNMPLPEEDWSLDLADSVVQLKNEGVPILKELAARVELLEGALKETLSTFKTPPRLPTRKFPYGDSTVLFDMFDDHDGFRPCPQLAAYLREERA